jgi:hypothetical protein
VVGESALVTGLAALADALFPASVQPDRTGRRIRRRR